MENIFEKLAQITKPEPVKKYMVKTETKGILYFDELPNYTYFCLGINGDPIGQAMYFTNDKGTCLIPIRYTKDGTEVIIPENAGKEIKNGKLVKA